MKSATQDRYWPDRQYPKIGIGQTEQTLATIGQTEQTLAPLARLTRHCPDHWADRTDLRPDRCPDHRPDRCPDQWPNRTHPRPDHCPDSRPDHPPDRCQD